MRHEVHLESNLKKLSRLAQGTHNHFRSNSVILIILLSLIIINQLNFPNAFRFLGAVTAEVDPNLLGTGPGRFNSIMADDIDDDGKGEIVFGNYDGYVTVLEFRNNEYFKEWQSPKIGHRVWGITVADFLGDSTKEIIVGNGDGEIYIYDAKTHKEVEYTYQFNDQDLVRDIHGLVVHDLGREDSKYLIAGTGYKNDEDQGTIYIFKSDSNSNFEAEAKIEGIDNRLRGIGVGDVDGDNELELVFGSGVATGKNPGKGYVRIYDINTVLTSSNPKPEWKSPDLKGDCVALELVDFTGDGYPDIVVGNGYRYQSGWVRILTYSKEKNDYIEHWKSENIGPKPYGLAVDDIDDDNKLEIIVGNQAGYIHIFEQTSSGKAKPEWKSKVLGSDILGVDTYDIDNDGQLEIIAAQGGYVGKGDYTSGYSEPHIYIIDGKTHKIEEVIGETSPLGFYLTVVILILLILLLVGLNFYIKFRKRLREAHQIRQATYDSPIRLERRKPSLLDKLKLKKDSSKEVK